MAKGNKNNMNVKQLSDQMDIMEKKMKELEEKNNKLEAKVLLLESRVIISEGVSTKLAIELDRLDQYHRRPNIIIKNAPLPENETNNAITTTVNDIIEKDLSLPNVVSEIDKFHRVGKVRTRNGKKHQDIIVRFKTHSSRYLVYKERKKARNVKISPNLTKRRATLLYEASNWVKDLDAVDFVFANIHGDLNLRLVEPYQEKILFPFSTLDDLKKA